MITPRRPFFSFADNQSALRAAAASWVGTPFHAHASVKGHGVDCVHFVAAVFIECGALASFDPPAYTMDGGQHRDSSQVLAWIEANPRFTKVRLDLLGVGGLWPGDVLCFRISRNDSAHHVGLFLGGPEWQLASAMQRYGVTIRTLKDRTWGCRLTGAYRLLEPGTGS
jgi:cell wall-associated NlpC family hydrolase